MASSSVIRARYVELLKKLFPRGVAWLAKSISTTDFYKYLESISYEFCRIEERANDLIRELDCSKTFELIDRWNELLEIPDECTPEDWEPTVTEQRQRICQKLTTPGGQSPAFYKLIAAQMGYTIDVLDVEEFQDFKAGISKAGDKLTNTTPGTEWAYTWAINAPADLARDFKAGQNVAGDKLKVYENETLECLMNKYKPAHTTVLFILS